MSMLFWGGVDMGTGGCIDGSMGRTSPSFATYSMCWDLYILLTLELGEDVGDANASVHRKRTLPLLRSLKRISTAGRSRERCFSRVSAAQDAPEPVEPQHHATRASSQGTENNGQGSVVPSYISKEGEEEPMMPGGAQSSLVSTAILDVNGADARSGMMVRKPSGVSRNGSARQDLPGDPAVVKADRVMHTGRALILAVDDDGVEENEVLEEDMMDDEGPISPSRVAITPGTSGRSIGVRVQPVNSPAASSASAMSHSLQSPIHGGLNQELGHTGHDESSDINAGEEADEYATRITNRHSGRGTSLDTGIAARPGPVRAGAVRAGAGPAGPGAVSVGVRTGTAMATVTATATAQAAAVAAAAAAAAAAVARIRDDGRGMHFQPVTRHSYPGGFHSYAGAEAPNLIPEDGDYSFYNESHEPYDAEMEEEIPTPIRDVRIGPFGGEHGGVNSSLGASSAREKYFAHACNSADGWVDQYTNCSLARDDPPKVERSYTAAAANPIEMGPWRTSGFSPAV